MGWSTQAVIAQLVIVEGSGDGVFVYNGTPAAGNLVASIAAQAGTDQFGNAYLAGQTSYGNTGGTFQACNSNGGVLNFLHAATEAGPWIFNGSVFTGGGGLTADTSWTVQGDVVISTAGNGVQVKEGANARMGTGTLSGGTATIANTSVTANTRCFITMRTHGANSGFVSVAMNAGVGFTVSSSNASDANTFNWLLVEAL